MATGSAQGEALAMSLIHLAPSRDAQTMKVPFAFYMVGGDMSPDLEHGDQLVADPKRRVRPGVACVFLRKHADGHLLAVVRRLVEVKYDHWHVRKYDPPGDYYLSREEWPRAVVISEIRRAFPAALDSTAQGVG